MAETNHTDDVDRLDKIMAFRVENEAMAPDIPRDAIIYVDKERTPINGNIVFVTQYPGAGRICRRYVMEGNNVYLAANDPQIPTLQFTESCVLGGVVVSVGIDLI